MAQSESRQATEQKFLDMLRGNLGTLESGQRFTGLLKDCFPQDKATVNLLSFLHSMGIHTAIDQSMTVTRDLAYRFAKRLTDEYMIPREHADKMVALFCTCYAEIQGKPCDLAGAEEQLDAEKQYREAAERQRQETERQNQDAAEQQREAAYLNSPDGAYKHGENYFYGQGVGKDYGKAAKWFRKAADQDHADAQNKLGDMYRFGFGVGKDYGEAAKWYRKAADQGLGVAQLNLGDMYHFDDDFGIDFSEAVRWYRKAADQGQADAQNMLGHMYLHGVGVGKDYAEAAKWYRKAADQGHAGAQNNLLSLVYNLHEPEKKNSDCYITTAVCQSLDKPDDCRELTLFRAFRDGWLKLQPYGDSVMRDYYECAPGIVAAIQQMPDRDKVYADIWKKHLKPCLALIERGDNMACFDAYQSMVLEMQSEYARPEQLAAREIATVTAFSSG